MSNNKFNGVVSIDTDEGQTLTGLFTSTRGQLSRSYYEQGDPDEVEFNNVELDGKTVKLEDVSDALLEELEQSIEESDIDFGDQYE